MKNEIVKPRITEVEALQKVVREMRSKGFEAGQIQRNIVKVAVVDLDELNRALNAA